MLQLTTHGYIKHKSMSHYVYSLFKIFAYITRILTYTLYYVHIWYSIVNVPETCNPSHRKRYHRSQSKIWPRFCHCTSRHPRANSDSPNWTSFDEVSWEKEKKSIRVCGINNICGSYDRRYSREVRRW